MSLPSLTPEFVLWVGLAGLVHGVIGYMFISAFTKYDPKWGFIGGIVPDLDAVFLILGTSFPFVHRGIMHTPAFILGLVLVMAWVWRSRHAAIHGVFAGGLLHLTIDSISGWGVMWLWPFVDSRILIPLHANGMQRLSLLIVSAVVLALMVPPKRRLDNIQ